MKKESKTEGKWFALVVFPQRELKIRDRLISLSENTYKDLIFDAFTPSHFELNKKTGKTKEVLDFTQYVYVKCKTKNEKLDNDAYHAVKIDGVRTVLGMDGPLPMREEKIEKLRKNVGRIEEKE